MICRVFEFDDPVQTIALHYQTAIARRISGLKPQYNHVIVAQCITHCLERFGLNKRRVAIQNDRRAIKTFQRLAGLSNGMGGAQLFLLNDDLRVFIERLGGGAHLIGPVACNNDSTRGRYGRT